ncbi:hypothetical protein [uncultured Flavonifractor sp.]|uniref:hypothetical protein n=1 Tax=uncultured Flavonifractor sp. TaxID=1193534 RepID=UPI0026044D86|nr:hypothetical protein [uncultured Flavonifractor sp.]
MIMDFFPLFTIFNSPGQSMWILLIFCVLCYVIWVPWQEYRERKQNRKKRSAKPKSKHADKRTDPPPSDPRQRLKQLEQLWKAGLYTDEEYRQERQEILKKL